MLVFWKARLVVLAVPKTGTTALEAALLPHADSAILNPPAQKHCTYRRYNRQLRPFFEGAKGPAFEVMAVVREPVSWLSSWYRYRSRAALDGSKKSTKGITFDDFVSAWLTPEPPAYAHVGRQSRFVSVADGRIGIDYLFRHDRMSQATTFLEDRLSVSLSLERQNVSPHDRIALSAAIETRLRTEASEEFSLWDQVCAVRS